jgi:hypothetical protein
MEERMARDEPEETFEHRRASAAFKGHGVKYDTETRRFYIDEATALVDHLELSGALSLLKYRDKRISELEAHAKAISDWDLAGALFKLNNSQAMCAKLADALKVAQAAMIERRERLTMDPIIFTQRAHRYDVEEALVAAALKEWEDGK